MTSRLTARCMFGLCAWWLLNGSLLASDECASAWIRGVFTGNSPRPEAISPDQLRDAPEVPGDTAVVGRGRSMLPLYPAGTRLVLREVPFPQLRPGQTVIYRNRAGRIVAHVLIARTRDGWRVRGLNNRLQDMEPVRAENLLGVVVAAYTANPSFPVGRSALFLSDE